MKIFASNRLELLSIALKEELFRGEGHPFAKKWVIVPNDRIQQDLFLQWSNDPLLQVAAGIKMITWPEALSRLFPHLPSQAELSLKIEAHLEKNIPDSLADYLRQGGRQRKISLSDKLSSLFLHYAADPQLETWLAKEGWQQTLWQAVLGPEIHEQKLLEGEVYLFHPSQLSLDQLHIFKKMETTCFLFSPCALYWGDLRTFRERKFLLSQAKGPAKEQLSRYFEEDHPLLANWGRKGRQLLSLFEEENLEELYEEPKSNSLLHTLQEEILTLSQLEKTPDESIQVHSAPTKLREVEVVWEIIQRLPYQPKEILVLAPDIQAYAPTIELVFRQRGGPFDFAIFGLGASSKSSRIQGFKDLLDLPKYRYSKESVEKLLFCPSFLKQFGFDIDEAHQLEEWMDKVHIRYDLKADHPSSWKAGLKRLIEALVKASQDFSIEFSQGDLLSRWIGVVEQFEKLQQFEKDHSIKEWATLLRDLAMSFFSPDSEDDLLRALVKFQQMNVEGLFSFTSIERILSDIFEQKSGSVQGSHLQAVRFATLEKGALLPSKAVILMGMDEGNFPRQETSSTLQQLPLPSRTDDDKYLFLEAFCSARDVFIQTYTRIDPEDGKSRRPCSLVDELSRYSKLLTTEHPFSSVDPFYFQGKGFQSFSKLHFEKLHTPFVREKTVPHLPLPELSHLDIWQLKKLARHPLRFFFEERLGLDFEWKESDSEFLLSPLEMSRLRKESLKVPLEKLLQKWQEEGKLPVGSFSQVAVQKIRDEIENYHANLLKLSVKPEEIFSIELKASCTEPTQIDPHRWIYPALHIGDLVIQGKLDDLCPQGILFHGDGSLSDQLKVWPLCLIAKNLSIPSDLLLTKKGKVVTLPIKSDGLTRYIDYAKKALMIPSPLHPAWARGVLQEEKIGSSEDDEILAWIESRGLLPPTDLWLKEWKPILQEAFHELL